MTDGQKRINLFMSMFMKNKVQFSYAMIFAVTIFIILAFFSIFAGTKALSFADGIKSVFSSHDSSSFESAKIILLKLRLPRTLSVIMCAASLSVAGLLLQLTMDNVLASPGVLGVNQGAAFFVLLSSLFFPYSFLIRSLCAFFGGVITIALVYGIGVKSNFSKTTLILSGVAVSSMMCAGIDVLITLHPEIVADKVAFNLGGFQNVSGKVLLTNFPIVFLTLLASFFLANGIDLFELGDETAFSLGLNVKRYRIISIICASILASSAVSICGMLSFVGLIVPNLIRICFRGTKIRTKKMILCCIFFGSDLLLFCDLLSRILFFPYELPVGLFLSCLGSPFFIFILITRRKKLSVNEKR